MSAQFTEARISNWTDRDQVRVAASSGQADLRIPPLVNLVQDAASLRFHFSVLPSQARELAAALLKSAEEAERAE